jgi:hypothetical protein
VVVFGLELDEPEAFEYVLDSLANVAPQIGIGLIPVYTNLYLNYRSEDAKDNFRFWLNELQGAVFAALAHAFAGRFTVLSIASSHDVRDLAPYGTHPLLDPYYSSSDLRIRQDGIALTRLEKTKLVAEWDVALQYLRVCNIYKRYRSDMLNCGRCEKCLRTMLALLALGKLDQTRSFPSQDVSAKTILSVLDINVDVVPFYRDLIEPLEKVGRSDLTHAIRSKIAEFENHPRLAICKPKIRKLLKHHGANRVKSSVRNRLNTGKDIKSGTA